MCLSHAKGPYVAEDDITVYKFLDQKPDLDNYMYHGLPFTAVIEDREVEGVLSVNIYSNLLYLCQNTIDGARCEELFGYKYSWYLDDNVRNLVVDGIPYEELPRTYITPYQRCVVKMGDRYSTQLGVRSNILVNEGGKLVNEGLHSFAEPIITNDDFENSVIAECIIPKGATYYKGIFPSDSTNVSYASDELVYVKIINLQK